MRLNIFLWYHTLIRENAISYSTLQHDMYLSSVSDEWFSRTEEICYIYEIANNEVDQVFLSYKIGRDHEI